MTASPSTRRPSVQPHPRDTARILSELRVRLDDPWADAQKKSENIWIEPLLNVLSWTAAALVLGVTLWLFVSIWTGFAPPLDA
jgi:hypothetical protein